MGVGWRGDGPDRLDGKEVLQELLQVPADLRRSRGECLFQGPGDLGDRRLVGELFPDKGGDLVHGVNIAEVTYLLANRNEYSLAGDGPGNEFLGPPIAGSIG